MIELDTEHAPLVVVRFFGPLVGNEVEEYLETHRDILELRTEHAVLVDVTNASPGDPASRCLGDIADWSNRHTDSLLRWCRACGVVGDEDELHETIESSVDLDITGVPTRVFGKYEEALEWILPVISGTDRPGPPSRPGDPSPATTTATPRSVPGLDRNEKMDWSPYSAG